MIEMIKEVIQYRDLMFMLTQRDLKVRYKQASMGFLWAVFMPIVAVMAGILIKKAMSVVSHEPLDAQGIVSITVKTLPWTFFISSIRFSVQALVGNRALVTKIYFPKAVLILSSILACLFDFGVALVVLILLLSIFKIGVSIYLLWIPLFFCSLGALHVRFGAYFIVGQSFLPGRQIHRRDHIDVRYLFYAGLL